MHKNLYFRRSMSSLIDSIDIFKRPKLGVKGPTFFFYQWWTGHHHNRMTTGKATDPLQGYAVGVSVKRTHAQTRWDFTSTTDISFNFLLFWKYGKIWINCWWIISFFFSFFLLQIPCSFILLPAIYMSIIVVAPPVQVFGSFPCLQDSIIIKAAGKERFLGGFQRKISLQLSLSSHA